MGAPFLVKIKHWSEFQHYKDRRPPWIKLHHALLDDYDFQTLPDASRALAPCIWLLASEHEDGVVDVSCEPLAFRVHQSPQWVKKALSPLIQKGFLIPAQDASNVLASCEQSACLETETETETETEKRYSSNGYNSSFLRFWDRYPKKVGKGAAAKSYATASKTVDGETLLRALEEKRGGLDNAVDYIPHPATWLNQRRWEDEAPADRARAADDGLKRRLGIE